LNYGALKIHDIADGTGMRTSLFVSGCTHHCMGCFQPETWDFNYGVPYTEEVEQTILDSLNDRFTEGLSILGGEPFEPSNQRVIVGLLRRVREERPEKNVWIYSGYTWEEITKGRAHCEVTDEILSMVDILVDGEYVQHLRDIRLKYCGSSNQRIIDVQKSLVRREVVLSPLLNH